MEFTNSRVESPLKYIFKFKEYIPRSLANKMSWSFVSGWIQVEAQWITSGHWSKILINPAPIFTFGIGGRPLNWLVTEVTLYNDPDLSVGCLSIFPLCFRLGGTTGGGPFRSSLCTLKNWITVLSFEIVSLKVFERRSYMWRLTSMCGCLGLCFLFDPALLFHRDHATWMKRNRD